MTNANKAGRMQEEAHPKTPKNNEEDPRRLLYRFHSVNQNSDTIELPQSHY